MVIVGIIINVVFGLLLVFLMLSFVTGAPYVPSSAKASHAMLLMAKIKKGMNVVDMGSGDGKLLFMSAREGAGSCIGYEINPYLALYTNICAFFSPYKKSIRGVWANFWTADLHDTDVVFLYLLPWGMDRMEKFLKEKMKPGSRVISNSFMFKHLTLVSKDEDAHVYCYRI